MTDIRRDLARNTLAILCILGLIGLSVWVLLPFLAATVWAVMIVVATWPLFRSLEARLGNRRGAAVAIMSVAMLLLLILPLWLAIDTIFDHSEQLTQIVFATRCGVSPRRARAPGATSAWASRRQRS